LQTEDSGSDFLVPASLCMVAGSGGAEMLEKYARVLPLAMILTMGLASAACGPSGHAGDGGADDDGMAVDAATHDSPFDYADAFVPPIFDAGNVYIDAGGGNQDGGCASSTCANPLPDGCGPTEICGNGSDDNCNGKVDENCSCTQGAVQPCFLGPPGYRGHGACTDGMQTCEGTGEFTNWGPCTGGIGVKPEACDSVDNDCNGCVDDDPMCCQVDLMCPTSMPDGQPFEDYVISGTTFYGGMVSNWQWTVTGGPCDQLLAPNVSYTLNGMANTTMVQGAGVSTLTIHPTLSGDYTVHVKMTLPDGTIYECEFIVHIGGPGVRVELCWDKTGTDDIDLHLHKPGTTTPWFTTDGSTNSSKINYDDCYYFNCKSSSQLFPPAVNWGYANSPLSECVGGPEGATWQLVGHCSNPRLDIDNISTVGKPENVNVDNPVNNNTYRAMVHFYGGSTTTHPLVNIYCGGHLKATFGQAPDLVPGFTSGSGFAAGQMWRVADITPTVVGGMTTDCAVNAIHPPGMTTGYYVTTNNTQY
jgi:hypothetical protein